MNPIQEHAQHLTRRSLFGRLGMGLGTAALASLMPKAQCTRRTRARTETVWWTTWLTALCPEGETRALLVHGWRTVSARHVRLQTENGTALR